MAASLKLISTPPDSAAPVFAPARFDLRVQPTRPGVAYEPVRVSLEADTLGSLSCVCATEGLGPEPWAALVIESARSLLFACASMDVDADQLVVKLDVAAEAPRCDRVPAGPGSRLIAYSRALRAAPARAAEPARSPIVLPVPYMAIVAWQRAAAAFGCGVDEWGAGMLAGLPAGRAAWEAAAAEEGQTMCEWVLAQAASCCSRSSAAAHSAG
jgi:hypothetical protein